MEHLGYPAYVLFLVLLAGGLLALFRPYPAFLFAVVLFDVPMVYNAVNTRTPFLGPYFNLYDALFVVVLLALIMDPRSRPLALPRPVFWILLIISWSVFQIFLDYNINYLVIRAIRWSITFPLAFFLGANLVVDKSRAKLFFFAIIAGSVLGAMRSFLSYQQAVALAQYGEQSVRMGTAGTILGGSFLVAATQQSFFPLASRFKKILWGAALILFGMTVLFGEWRSVYLAILGSVIAMPFVLNRWRNMTRTVLMSVVGLPLILLAIHLTLPTLNPAGFFERITPLVRYVDKGVPEIAHYEDQTRVNQIEREVEEWSKGNWFLGRGLNYNVFLSDGLDKRIAWGHIEYISDLSNFGLVGLLILGIYLPWRIFRAARFLYDREPQDPVGLLGLTAIATVLQISIISFMSAGYTSVNMHTVGFFYGAIWALAYGKSPDYNFVTSGMGYLNPGKKLMPINSVGRPFRPRSIEKS